MPVGYARCSTDAQDLTAQRNALTALGVKPNRIYVDHGLTGTTRARPGLREALAACRSGDTLVVTKLDRLARSLTDARNIVEELTEAGVKLNIGGSLHDPTDPVGRLLFNVLGMIAEFESDLIRMRTREGMKVAKAKGRLRGKQPKLKPAQEAHLVELWRAGKHTSAELAELFSVARSTVYRAGPAAGPLPGRRFGRADRAGTRGAGHRRTRAVQRRDREPADGQLRHRQDPRPPPADQAGSAGPSAAGHARRRVRRRCRSGRVKAARRPAAAPAQKLSASGAVRDRHCAPAEPPGPGRTGH